jgi:maltooligosyltrehalose trehalohydrolase
MDRTASAVARRLPVGAEASAVGAGVHFRIWAPNAKSMHVVLEDDDPPSETAMQQEPNGYFSTFVRDAGAGSLYRYRLDASDDSYPDPASRFQPLGPHGPSQVVDAEAFNWTDGAWKGMRLERQVLYELHVGTLTGEGTWQAAASQLARLAELGITAIEVMPVAEFPGRFGWGYDGVNLFAPFHRYGSPDDFRAFVDHAHSLGVGVLLDVVYNHFGPDGNYLGKFARGYFSTKYKTEWGEAINFDDEAGPVREFVLSNVAHWIGEYHLDGLRLDATQQIFDASSPHILQEIAERARLAAGPRSVVVVAENEPQHVRLIRSVAEGGYGLDGLWNDDFHHAACVALTGRAEAYLADFYGGPQELVSLAKWGFLFQGQRYSWQSQRRGSPTFGIAPARFITFLENHDQVANAPWGNGERMHQMTSPGAYRAVTAYWLLSPGTPMLFQGQEFGASSPFRYFADHAEPLAQDVRRGRATFMSQFRSSSATNLFERLAVPSDERTFRECQLPPIEPYSHERSIALHRDLLAIRRDDPLIGGGSSFVDGAVIGSHTFAIRFFTTDPRKTASSDDGRLLIVNLGRDLRLDPAPEPLLAPPEGSEWVVRWSSEDPLYGGMGTAPLETDANWLIPGYSAVLLASRQP